MTCFGIKKCDVSDITDLQKQNVEIKSENANLKERVVLLEIEISELKEMMIGLYSYESKLHQKSTTTTNDQLYQIQQELKDFAEQQKQNVNIKQANSHLQDKVVLLENEIISLKGTLIGLYTGSHDSVSRRESIDFVNYRSSISFGNGHPGAPCTH